MESKCSFFKLLGGICDYDKPHRSGDTVPLLSCDRGIWEYVRSVGKSDISSKVELILARASMFSFPIKISAWTVCPAHCSTLGINWRRGANGCRPGGGGGGYCRNFLVGMCRWDPGTLSLYQS